MDWTISDGSGGESYTVGRAESESEVEIAGKPQENQLFRDGFFRETDVSNDYSPCTYLKDPLRNSSGKILRTN